MAKAGSGPVLPGDVANEQARLRAVRSYGILDTPPDGAFDRITALAAHIFKVPIALVTVVDEDRIWLKSRFGLDDVTEVPRSPGLCASAICENRPYIVEDAVRDPRTLANPLVAGKFGLRFYAAAPIRTREGYNLGTVCVIDREPRELRDPKDAETLETLARIVADEFDLRLSAIHAIRSERERSRRVADVLQRALLPNLTFSSASVELDSVYRPAADEAFIGGDWFDAFAMNGDELLVSVGDVTGHGMESAIVMGKLRYALRTLAYGRTNSPIALLGNLDSLLRREDPDTIATAFVGRLGLRTGRLVYASAGHPPPLLRARSGSISELQPGGVPLGLNCSGEASEATLQLSSGDMLCLYTDGLIEATHDPLAGLARLYRRLRRADLARDPEPAKALAASLIPENSPDDVAILTARFLGVGLVG